MITIKCSQCKRKIFKYNKIGKGRILRCWDTRIIEDYSIRCDNEVRCKCGNVIGIKESKSICPTHCTQFQSEIQSLYPQKYIAGGAGRIIEI
jgi:hypothetical protein